MGMERGQAEAGQRENKKDERFRGSQEVSFLPFDALACVSACFSAAWDGTFPSLPDSSG